MIAQARQALMDQLIAHEAMRLKPYTDTVGKITLGCGRNLTDVGLSLAEAMVLLEHDVDAAITDLSAAFPWYLRLDAVRQRVVTDMRFNLGPRRFRGFTRMIAALAAGDYVLAAQQMRASKWFRQVRSRGVRLARMMETGVASAERPAGPRTGPCATGAGARSAAGSPAR